MLADDIFYVKVDRNKKVPITVLIRALGFGTNAEILDMFGEEPKLLATMELSLIHILKKNSAYLQQQAL